MCDNHRDDEESNELSGSDTGPGPTRLSNPKLNHLYGYKSEFCADRSAQIRQHVEDTMMVVVQQHKVLAFVLRTTRRADQRRAAQTLKSIKSAFLYFSSCWFNERCKKKCAGSFTQTRVSNQLPDDWENNGCGITEKV